MANEVLLTGFFWYGESAPRWPVGLIGRDWQGGVNLQDVDLEWQGHGFGSAFAAAYKGGNLSTRGASGASNLSPISHS